jgi:four helix bundle protein
MSRDHTKLRAFHLADELVVDVYVATRSFPAEERYGLQAQMRRAAVRIASTLVEGCARRTLRDYAHFVTMALASACQVRYLVTVARKLEMIPPSIATPL